jgi:transposase
VKEKASRKLLNLDIQKIYELCRTNPEEIVAIIYSMQELINSLESRVTELEERAKKDSHNSHKPPSTDKDKQKTFSLTKKEKSKKKPGGQKGHPGKTLQMVSSPAKIKLHKLASCSQCGISLRKEKNIEYTRRQVFEIPKIQVEVTEHRAEVKICSHCGQTSMAPFPAKIGHKTQYGDRLKAFAVYLSNYGLLPYERTAELFEDIFNIPLSPGTLFNINQKCSTMLTGVEKKIKDQIANSHVAHFDETGMNIGGKRKWLHVESNSLFTYYYPHDNRGKQATRELGILPEFKGTAVHDGYQSYFSYPTAHALCNAHHLRELTFIYEEYKQRWAKKMINFLLEVKKVVEKRKIKIPAKILKKYEQRYKRIIAEGMKVNPIAEANIHNKRRGRKKQSKARNLLARLDNYRKEVLAFMYDPKIPFDNNQAERDIRMTKVQQKISGLFRSYWGAEIFCRIRGFISSVKKHSLKVIDELFSIISSQGLTSNLLPAPS